MNDAFVEAMRTGYMLDEPSIVVGNPMREGELHQRDSRRSRCR